MSASRIRQPIVCVLGHVDVGKTSLLDKIRGTAVTLREPGTMTQHIGASFIPQYSLKKICGSLLEAMRIELDFPGLLFIDTPGHEAFVNLRRRGGSIADIAVLVIDITKGFQTQTYESIDILRSRKTPFVVAANKVDRIPGWKSFIEAPITYSIKRQDSQTLKTLEDLKQKIIHEFYRLNFMADSFDKIRDFSKTIAVIPTSAKTGEGIPELLMVIIGLAQKYLRGRLKFVEGPAKGVVLEVREELGLGLTIDAIIYDGIIRRGDTIVIGGLEKPIVSRVRALLLPKPLDEMRSPEDRFMDVEEVSAAAGVKIAAPEIEGVVAGAPLHIVDDHAKIESIINTIKEEVSLIKFYKNVEGVIIKADTLGSLEALTNFLERLQIPVRVADIGHVSKRDVLEAKLVSEYNTYRGVVLAFNVKILPEAEIEAMRYGVKIFQDVIIYRLVEEYQKWFNQMMLMEKERKLASLVHPGKIRILPQHVFRRSEPIIVGVEILIGKIMPGYTLIRIDGKVVGEIMQIQDKGKPLKEASKGMSVAISIRSNMMVGRHINENDILFVDVPLDHIRVLLKEFTDILSDEEIELLKKISKIRGGE
ncbi:MAG: translation initiation factor IF-2 [Candidatus Methanomethylicia archaeon]|nr:translation initiation factor IF-2 [Candidatus Methanomethylicia archaeon]MCX8169065.1 translation initiation factor IF-2 [Candidatus Methanomethylicia archaeon]MDW7988797.1 translation initiation factor IF-2 [Nitrososphaerota archaeon]